MHSVRQFDLKWGVAGRGLATRMLGTHGDAMSQGVLRIDNPLTIHRFRPRGNYRAEKGQSAAMHGSAVARQCATLAIAERCINERRA